MTRDQRRRPIPSEPLSVVNIGLEIFAEALSAEGVEVIHVDWRPPTGGDPRLTSILTALEALDD